MVFSIASPADGEGRLGLFGEVAFPAGRFGEVADGEFTGTPSGIGDAFDE